jgi:hypothetical protein
MTETDLCDVLIQAAEGYGWTCYPETSGWDILLVRDEVQIGVQAKLRANVKVIAQCLPDMAFWGRKLSPSVRRKEITRGPHYRAVLVPRKKTTHKSIRDLCNVCQALGIWVLTDDMLGWHLLKEGSTIQPDYDWKPQEPEWLPDFVPKVAAGASGPTQLTQWKQKALRFMARAKVRGSVTSKDAKELDLHMQLFIDRPVYDPWLVYDRKEGRLHVYTLYDAKGLGPETKRPDIIHPEAFQHYLEEAKKEMNDG